jgi:hypothetical protein
MRNFCLFLGGLFFWALNITSGYCSSDENRARLENLDTNIITAAQKGDPAYQFIVGFHLMGGFFYDPRYTEEALDWLFKAHKQGNANATAEISYIYSTKGSEEYKDPVKAFEYALLSVKRGSIDVLLHLPKMYYWGKGTLPNYSEAYAWSATALAVSDNENFRTEATELLDEIRCKMTDPELSKAQVLAEKHFKSFRKARTKWKNTSMYKTLSDYYGL